MIADDEKRYIEGAYGKPYSEIRSVAEQNLINAGCPKKDIDFVLEYGGIYQAYENRLPFDLFKTRPRLAIEILTTD